MGQSKVAVLAVVCVAGLAVVLIAMFLLSASEGSVIDAAFSRSRSVTKDQKCPPQIVNLLPPSTTCGNHSRDALDAYARDDHRPVIPGLPEEEYKYLHPYKPIDFRPAPSRLLPAMGDSTAPRYCLQEHNNSLIYFVVAAHAENLEWTNQLPKYPLLVYTHDPNNIHHHPINVGHEIPLYLKYMLDYWDCLPQFTIFLHGHGPSGTWHGPTILEEVWKAVREIEARTHKHGYWSLNYTPYPVEGRMVKCSPVKVMGPDYQQQVFMALTWDELYRDEFGYMPPYVNSYCCLQFALHRSRIRMRPRAYIERLISWIVNHEISKYCCKEGKDPKWFSFWSEHVLEVYLPWIFGEPYDVPLREGCDNIYLKCP